MNMSLFMIWAALLYKSYFILGGLQWMWAQIVQFLWIILDMRLDWHFYLHSGIEETGSPGIICIVCHSVLHHPAGHGTSTLRKHLLAKVHIAMWNKLTKSEVTELTSSTVDETALAILKRPGSRGIAILNLQMQFIFTVYVWSRLTGLTDKTLQTGSDGLCHYRISPRHLELLPHVRNCFGSYSMECYI